VRRLLQREIPKIAGGVASALGAKFEFTYRRGYPPTINEESMTDLVRDSVREAAGTAAAVEQDVSMGAEDMSLVLQEVPGCYFFLGSMNTRRGLVYPHHSAHFNFDEGRCRWGRDVASPGPALPERRLAAAGGSICSSRITSSTCPGHQARRRQGQGTGGGDRTRFVRGEGPPGRPRPAEGRRLRQGGRGPRPGRAVAPGGLNAFVIDKLRFSRAPKIFKALKAVETPDGLLFTIETAPAPGQLTAQIIDLPQPRGLVQAAILGFYTETKRHTDVGRSKFSVSSSSKSEIREPFVHLYSEDPHTILEVRGPKFEWAASGKFREYWAISTGRGWRALFGLLQVQAGRHALQDAGRSEHDHRRPQRGRGPRHVGGGGRGGSSSSDDTPLALAASRIIVYSLVFGL